MALEKVITYDYFVHTDYKHINEKETTTIMEDGKELSYAIHRRVLTPDMDVSSESDEIKSLTSAVWTDEVKKAWSDKQKANAERE